MARQNSALEFAPSNKGIITEASPLNFPEGASLDEKNFVLQKDGSRRRRLGMDFEDNYALVPTQAETLSGELVCTSFTWENAGGTGKDILVTQLGHELLFWDITKSDPSQHLLYTFTVEISENPTDPIQFSYAQTSGYLTVATGDKEFLVFAFRNDQINHSYHKIKVRDFWGLEDINPLTGVDLRSPEHVSERVAEENLTANHIYNLRNQSWALPRKDEGSEDIKDPLLIFTQTLGAISAGLIGGIAFEEGNTGVYPSNSDVVATGLFPNPEDADDRTSDRLYPNTVIANDIGSSPAPKGHFIIDAIDRSQSRVDAIAGLQDRYANAIYPDYLEVDQLPLDATEGGPACVAGASGRIWLSGITGRNRGPEDILGGAGYDPYAPNLTSYVFFSQLVRSTTDVGRCYQQADPTSPYDSDLVDTDGGYVVISGADRIIRLMEVGNSVLVFANNGVWSISGGNDYGFTATSYRVDKITDAGMVGPYAAVRVGDGILYWSGEGIYQIGRSEVGTFQAQNISENTIQTMYNEIPTLDREYCRGHFDKYDRKVRWVYNCRLGSYGNVKELVLDITTGAFYKNEINRDGYPLVLALAESTPYQVEAQDELVTVDGDTVTQGGEDVTYENSIRINSTRDIKYLTVVYDTFFTGSAPQYAITFSKYKDQDFLDWATYTDGSDADAFLITGYAPGGEYQRYKQIPYLTMHFLRTEDGFEADAQGDLYPTSPSSCLVQARWEWANSANSNRWGREFQAYRYRRHYIPQDASDPYDTGFETIITKNKIRGKGRVVSFKMSTEPGKDCRLLGWSMILGVNGNV